jgi:hypothetical protein
MGDATPGGVAMVFWPGEEPCDEGACDFRAPTEGGRRGCFEGGFFNRRLSSSFRFAAPLPPKDSCNDAWLAALPYTDELTNEAELADAEVKVFRDPDALRELPRLELFEIGMPTGATRPLFTAAERS